MNEIIEDKKLGKKLGLIEIFCIATGAMISSGLFILPGLAYSKAGPAVILSYLLAGVFCIPTLFSQAELTTAMPKAGGDYFYITRGFGPLLGTIAGFSSWFALSMKGAFALIGMGAYISYVTAMPIQTIAIACGLFFIILNLAGVKEAGTFQVVLVAGLIAILGTYVIWGAGSINEANFRPFFSQGIGSVFATASFVFISYGGLTKVAAIAEEAKNPGRDLPLSMILSLLVTALLYGLVIYVTVGVSDPDKLASTLTPISDGAFIVGGGLLKIIISVAAFLAFISTANAAIMTASRYPLGMSRDKILPKIFKSINSKTKTPMVAIIFTGSFMIAMILFLRLELLVKVASSLLILLFTFANASVIMFRESKILSYRPKFRAPLYPYMQIAGIIGGLFLLIEMGTVIMFFVLVFLTVGFGWYKLYAEKRTSRDSVLMYALERLISKDTEFVSDNILSELKEVVMERDQIIKDRFHKIIEESIIIDVETPITSKNFFEDISELASTSLNAPSIKIFEKLNKREEESSTVVRPGLAIPHIIIGGENIFRIFIARARDGIIFPGDRIVHTIFVLISSLDERNFHLKVLAAIAQITQGADFDKNWLSQVNKEELRNILLLAERRRDQE